MLKIDWNEIKISDTAFEWFSILLGIFQATLFQFITWKYQEYQNFPRILSYMIVLTIPLIIMVISWISSIMTKKVGRVIQYKLFSWSLSSGTFINYISILSLYYLSSFYMINITIKGIIYISFYIITTSLVVFKLLFNISNKYKSIVKNVILWDDFWHHRFPIMSGALLVGLINLILLPYISI